MAVIKRIYYFHAFDDFRIQSTEARLGILTCGSVEKHEVLEVGDLPPLPALGHVGRFEKLPRGGQGDAPG